MSEPRAHFVKRKVNVRFLYCLCNDVVPVRRFYTELLGCEELGFMSDEKFGWVGYDSEGMQLMFFRWDTELPARTAWDWQPGDGAGDAPGMSFSVEIEEGDARAVFDRLRALGVPAMSEGPTWRQDSYWGWTVRDPAGNTVELYWKVQDKPADPAQGPWD